jgi:hypothetical protein
MIWGSKGERLSFSIQTLAVSSAESARKRISAAQPLLEVLILVEDPESTEPVEAVKAG